MTQGPYFKDDADVRIKKSNKHMSTNVSYRNISIESLIKKLKKVNIWKKKKKDKF